jgi:hypothetical protein
MSKTKLAIFVFCVAFGVNLLAFVFSKKTFLIEETKSVWMYELPQTLSPLDSYSAKGMGPHSGVIGTLFLPTQQGQDQDILQSSLTDQWNWNEKTLELTAKLRAGLNYSDGSPILASHWVESILWVQSQTLNLGVLPEWQAFTRMKVEAPAPDVLRVKLASVPAGFQFILWVQNVLTHPLSGVIHPQNLQQLKNGERVTKNWVSSGPYRVRKWKPKEIILVSRDDFPVRLDEKFFRTLRFQSSPIKNPASDFIQANATEIKQPAAGTQQSPRALDRDLQEHSVTFTADEVTVFWLCRSWKDEGRFCAEPGARGALAKVLAASDSHPVQPGLLAGKVVKFRIPIGSDAFRTEFRKQLVQKVEAAGGRIEEISYFFKESKDADLELGFAVTPVSGVSKAFAMEAIRLSSRLGSGAWAESNVVGEVFRMPLMILMKRLKPGDPFRKVFLEPDIEEKTLSL